jgi:hypothetical protein
MRHLLLVLVLVGVVGCGRDEPKYGAKPLSEWVEQARAKVYRERVEAYDALGRFSGNETAIKTLEEVVKNEATSPGERILAARSLYRATGDAERVIAPVRAAIRKEADSPSGFQSTKEVDELVFWLGAKAQPLTADLQYAQGKIAGRDAASKKRREEIQQVASGIPKE